jgi:ABC-type multidrug transport system fused ATPase/permease subunit
LVHAPIYNIEIYLKEILIYLMQCQRCGKKLGEYLCSECNRVVCSDCKVIKDGKILCLDCAKVEDKSLKSIKKAIYTVLIFLCGVFIIYFIANSYISKIEMPGEALEIPVLMDFLKYFELLGLYSMIGLSIILVILIIIFFIKRRRKKSQNI